MLHKNTNYRELESKLPVDKIDDGTIMLTDFKLQAFNDIYFKSDFIDKYSKPKAKLLNVIILSIVGIIILFVSINNFIIFSVFDAQNILKDLAIRKVVGTSLKNLKFQYFTNAFVYSFFGLFIAITIVYLLTPYFNQLFAVDLFKTISENTTYIFAMLLIV